MKVYKKEKAGRQDLLFGLGKETQQRGQETVELDKIAVPLIVADFTELAGVNPDEFPFVSVQDNVGTLDFVYWPNATAQANGLGVIDSLVAGGKWVMSNNYRREQLLVRTVESSITISAIDASTYINVLSDTDITLSLSNDYDRSPIGSVIYVHQAGGLGQVNIVPINGVTVNSPGSLFLRTRFSTVALVCKDWAEWDIMGDIND